MADRNIRALVVTEHGGGDVLAVRDERLAPPGPGEVQIRVAASGVNFIDVYQRQGVYPIPTPFVLGGEAAGDVVAVGDGVDGFAVGDVVASASLDGAHASFANLRADKAAPVPVGVSAELAAAVLLQGMTAHYLVTSTYQVRPGDAVLVHAAAGGVGQLLVQLAKARGARVIGTASTAEKVARAEALGADEMIRYDQVDDLATEVHRRNGGKGVAAAYDGVGQATFDASLASLAPRGTLALFGAASGQVPPFDLQRLNRGGSLFVTRPTLAHYIATREELLWRAGELFGALAAGTVQVEIGGRYSLADASRAYDDLESRRSTGKLLLIP